MATQRGTQITGNVTVDQPEDKWSLGTTKRTCERVLYTAYPEILGNIESRFPLGAVADTAFPLVKLARRDPRQSKSMPHLCKLTLFYEQTEPDPGTLDPLPEDDVSEEASLVVRPVGEHPGVQAIGELFRFYDPERRRFRFDDDVPQKLRGRASYPVSLRRVRVTKFGRSPFPEPVVNVRKTPGGASSLYWMVTGGYNGRRGRFYTQTLVYTNDPDGYPDEIYFDYS